MAKNSTSWFKWLLVGTVFGIVLIGIADAAMRYTDARPFCSSCHIMSEAALTHKESPHANLACNECHAPYDLISKLPFKAKEGIRDVVSNLKGNDVPVDTMLETKNVVNDNCIRCHITTNMEVDVMAVKPYCVDCHKGAAHQNKKPISTRTVADE